MNDKLTLQELSAYLPWGLKVQYQGITNLKELSEHNKKEPKGWNVLDDDYISWVNSKPREIIGTRVSVIKKIEFYKGHVRLYVGKRHGYLKLVWFDEIKPLLRPLSDLTKEIEHNGERFVPIERISEMYGIDIMTDERNNLIAPITLEPYNAIRQLCEWHFDLFNLVSRNLAIDLNTIKQ